MQDLLRLVVAGLLLGGIYASVAIGLNLLFGVVRVVNFAHGELVMLGVFGAYYAFAFWGLDPYLAMFLVAPLVGVVGYAIQKWIIGPLLDEPLMQIFATFGLVIVFQNLVLAFTRGEAKTVRSVASGTTVDIGVILSLPRAAVFLFATLLTVGLVLFLNRTTLGTAVRAVSQDRDTARLMGVNVERVYLLTFFVAAALAGAAGALLSPIYTAVPTVGFQFILPAFAVVVLGGLGSTLGSYVGGLMIGLIEVMSGFYISPSLRQAVWFTLFLAVLVIKPTGLFGQPGSEEIGT